MQQTETERETERSLDSGPAASELELKLKRAEVRGRERSPWQTDKRLCAAASHRGAWDYANKSARALRRKTGGSRRIEKRGERAERVAAGGERRGGSEGDPCTPR